MKDYEKLYYEEYKETKDVTEEECYAGGKHCASCMYRREYGSNFEPFENSYCTAVRKE